MRSNSRAGRHWMLAALLATPVLGAVLFLTTFGENRTGADEQASEAVEAVHSYKPWFKPLWEPPNADAEGLLFVAQAAAGVAVLGYAILRLTRSRGS